MANNSEATLVTYLHEKGREQGVAVSGTFELTQRCNFNCEMCYVHDLKQTKDPLSAQDFLSLGEKLRQEGTIFLLLTGGEPLLREDFDEIYEGLIKMGFIISINSNGSLIDKHIALFQKYPPTRFNISLYGADDTAYQNLCHVQRFEKVISNIRLLRENGIGVRLNYVATPANAKDYEKILDIARELDVPVKATAYAYPAIRLGKTDNEARLSAEDAALYTLKMDRKQYPLDLYIQRLKHIVSLPKNENTGKIRCRAGSCSFWITADGKLLPCGMLPEPYFLPLQDGFTSAWEGLKASTLEIEMPKACTTCPYGGFCIVCAAMCKAENGNFNQKPQYICDMMHALFTLAKKELEGLK